eukprot:7818365-Karenia_brevis.AAC.1
MGNGDLFSTATLISFFGFAWSWKDWQSGGFFRVCRDLLQALTVPFQGQNSSLPWTEDHFFQADGIQLA